MIQQEFYVGGGVVLSRCLLRIPAHSKSTSIAIKHTFMQVCPEGMETFIVFCCLSPNTEVSRVMALVWSVSKTISLCFEGKSYSSWDYLPNRKVFIFAIFISIDCRIAHFPQNRIVNLTLYCIAKYKPSSNELLCQTPATTLGWVHVPYLIHI